MRFLPLLLLAGCAASPVDKVLLEGGPLDSLPDAWLIWRPAGEAKPLRLPPKTAEDLPQYQGGFVVFADGRVEAAGRGHDFSNFHATRIYRRRGTISEADRAELLRALDAPLAPPVFPPPVPTEGFRPETEGGGRFEAEVRGPDGKVRLLRYERWMRNDVWAGGEPLLPLVDRLLKSLRE